MRDAAHKNHAFGSRIVDAGGIKTHFVEAGSGDRTLVLVHGGGPGADSLGNWSPAIARLAGEFRIIAVDMVGFGRSAKPDGNYEYSHAGRVSHLAAFLTQMGIKPATVIGNSMGGMTALGVAKNHPDLVSDLILMGSAGISAQPTAALQTLMAYDFTIEGMGKIVRALTAPGYEPDSELVNYRYQLSIDQDARRALEAVNRWIESQGGLVLSSDEIRAVTTRTLVIAGKQDQVVPVESSYKFLELLPNSWGYIMPHCGHWPMIEAPDQFADVIRHFLK
jgi:2-hydroxy-6-oxo-6-(2'-aminophenyl)hexa-2,4-dienoate hydrolase